MSRMQTKSKSYEEFVDKFKGKKTTDDCTTPAAVYDAVLQWVQENYGEKIAGKQILRPFYPGGDYTTENYDNAVVIDNPPFSILHKITDFYNARGILYFLFAPGLTCFNNNVNGRVLVSSNITYTNGAKVRTGFVTNLEDEPVVILARKLSDKLKEIDSAAHNKAKAPIKLAPYCYGSAVALKLVRRVDKDTRLKIKERKDQHGFGRVYEFTEHDKIDEILTKEPF